MDHKLLYKARKHTAFNDIMSFEYDDINDCDVKEFAKEYYKAIDTSERSDVMCDFICDRDVLPFNDTGGQSEEWFRQFEEYLMELWSDPIVQYLTEAQASYMDDDSNAGDY